MNVPAASEQTRVNGKTTGGQQDLSARRSSEWVGLTRHSHCSAELCLPVTQVLNENIMF